jgi:hypothetical protein
MGLTPEIVYSYATLNRLFLQFLNTQTEHNRILLSGTFAKMDYLLKEHNASQELKHRVNNLRIRLRRRETLSEEILAKHIYDDISALSEFIKLVGATDSMENEELSTLQSLWGDRQDKASADKAPTKGSLIGEYCRMIVERCDENFIYGSLDNDEYPSVCVSLKQAYASTSDVNHSYLRNIVTPGCQLNLVRPRLEAGIIFCEIIIYEPDYLVDVSNIAGCFESYTTSALVSLIKRISPAPKGDAINLGNFAGQMLDEEIHCNELSTDSMRSYAESAKEFFRNNAITLAANPPGHNFNDDARRQKLNIHRALKEDMRSEIHSFDTRNVIVEPTFFSEMLGLQGRMDMLQLDYKVVLEQKSGKGGYIRNDDLTHAIAKEQHYVQLLLYMAILRYNYREIYDRNNHELHAFLLYSKYDRSLVSKGFAPQLLAKAFEVRNNIVYNELHYATDGFEILDTLDPMELNEKSGDALWQRFTLPQLNATLSPIQEADTLSKLYYYRFMRFVAMEHLYAKIGNRRRIDSGFSSTWLLSCEEKREAGNIFMGLRMAIPQQSTEGGIQELSLTFEEAYSDDLANFRIGDIVILYSYKRDSEPDARRNIVFRGSLKSYDKHDITLQLRAPQSDARVFKRDENNLWAIEHDFLESSFSSYYKSLQYFLIAPQHRRDLLLFQREPEIDKSRALKGDYGDFNELALHVKQARDFYIIIGPPGTGKTSYGMLTTLQEELLEPESSVLIMSYTNRAIDEVCSKLVEADIDFMRIGSRLSCAPEYHSYIIAERVKTCNNIHEVREVLMRNRVYVATTSALNSQSDIFTLKHFDLAIIDEASQILEPHLIGLLSRHKSDGSCAIRKFVMIGDHKQLPAVVQQSAEESAIKIAELNEIGLTNCRISLFERLLKRYKENPAVTYMLNRQGRMHHDIAEFPSQFFYEGLLTEVPLKHQLRPLPKYNNDTDNIYNNIVQQSRMSFIDVMPDSTSHSDKINVAEARTVALIVKEIYHREGAAYSTDSIGIIVPYRNQIATIRKEIECLGIATLGDICIDTVERYQGSQKRYIIYSFTISKPYQLTFLTENSFEENGMIIDRKLNVALTRAKESMIIVGNATLLGSYPLYKRLIEFIASRGGLYRL